MWEWLGDHLAIDFVNTVRRRGRDYEELFRSADDVVEWAGHESARVPSPDRAAVTRRLDEIRAVRDDVFALLAATAAGQALPSRPRRRVNARVRAHPVIRLLGSEPGTAATQVAGEPDPVDTLLSRVAASAVELITDPESAVALCDAPSCGQFFVRARANQRWCGPACGNRARVARHAHR